jgi:isoleucyl-tRNA synthetase
MLDAEGWAEVGIVSGARFGDALAVHRAPGDKCARCWRVLPEVGHQPGHAALCVRCAGAVGPLSCDQAAE